ncbi:GFA family protein [Mesorhizobium sp. LSHC412B00]|uniref:GFA family protein n=1 Tax=Mesorhizobium sp. LSHC412B00 TaxID=1287285 RepID=UPI001FD8AFBF|nr:GFA family protein [Mesorhizobium sp. LSHC412B00]
MDDKPRTTIRKPARIDRGHCFCGAITAEFSGDPFWICFDHDDDCRRAIGSPLTIWIGYRPDQVDWLGSKPKTFSKTRGVVRSFCSECGTSIGYTDEGLPNEFYISIGFMDAPEKFHPQAQAYWEMRLPFIRMDDGCLASRATPGRATPPWAIPETGEAGGWIRASAPGLADPERRPNHWNERNVQTDKCPKPISPGWVEDGHAGLVFTV